MKLIVITSPDFIPEEARIITGLFEVGLDLLHLRKPDATAHEVGNLLHGILWNTGNRLLFMISFR